MDHWDANSKAATLPIHYSLFSGTFNGTVRYSELEPFLRSIARGMATQIPLSDLIDGMWSSLLQHASSTKSSGDYYCVIQLPHLVRFDPSALKDERFTMYPRGKYCGKLSLMLKGGGGVLRWNQTDSEYVIQAKISNQPFHVELALEDLRYICDIPDAEPATTTTMATFSPKRIAAGISSSLTKYWVDFKDAFYK